MVDPPNDCGGGYPNCTRYICGGPNPKLTMDTLYLITVLLNMLFWCWDLIQLNEEIEMSNWDWFRFWLLLFNFGIGPWI